MLKEDMPTMNLSGSYRDVMRDDAGRVTWDSGWQKNQIVIDCRRLLAAFMRGQANNLGIQGIKVGQGDPAWDQAGTPPPQPTDTLFDTKPVLVDLMAKVGTTTEPAIKLDYLDPQSGKVSAAPTQRLQIMVTIAPGLATATLREFGLVGQLGITAPPGSTGQPDHAEVLINLVRHVAIVKDGLSTLVRTIQLVF